VDGQPTGWDSWTKYLLVGCLGDGGRRRKLGSPNHAANTIIIMIIITCVWTDGAGAAPPLQ
jgi:hypothetical protein